MCDDFISKHVYQIRGRLQLFNLKELVSVMATRSIGMYTVRLVKLHAVFSKINDLCYYMHLEVYLMELNAVIGITDRTSCSYWYNYR